MSKTILKDALNITNVEAKKSVKTLTNTQVTNLCAKLTKLLSIAQEESNARYTALLEEEADNELDEQLENEVEETENN